METLRALLCGVSAQQPSHSVFVGDQQLPLEARMGGILLGFLCALILITVLGRLRASETPSGLLGPGCWFLIALTGLDGLNAFLFDGNLPHVYSPSAALRLVSGPGAGLDLGLIAIPVVGSVVWKQPSEEASIDYPIELLAGPALVGLVGGLMLVGVGVLLWPIALATLAAVLVAFGVANLYVILLATRNTNRAKTVGRPTRQPDR